MANPRLFARDREKGIAINLRLHDRNGKGFFS